MNDYYVSISRQAIVFLDFVNETKNMPWYVWLCPWHVNQLSREITAPLLVEFFWKFFGWAQFTKLQIWVVVFVYVFTSTRLQTQLTYVPHLSWWQVSVNDCYVCISGQTMWLFFWHLLLRPKILSGMYPVKRHYWWALKRLSFLSHYLKEKLL